MPTDASSTPPIVGPRIWLALLAPTSIDIAALIRSGPTTSPIIVRRTGLSVDQPMPLQKRRDRQMPDGELAGPGQQRQGQRGQRHRQHDERSAPCAARNARQARRSPRRTAPSAASAASSARRRQMANGCADRRTPRPPAFRASAPRRPPARPATTARNRGRRSAGAARRGRANASLAAWPFAAATGETRRARGQRTMPPIPALRSASVPDGDEAPRRGIAMFRRFAVDDTLTQT